MFMPYLQDLLLSYTTVTADENNDHEHCDVCWNKISGYPNDIHQAYSAKQGQIWICPECYKQFKNVYHWKLREEDPLRNFP